MQSAHPTWFRRLTAYGRYLLLAPLIGFLAGISIVGILICYHGLWECVQYVVHKEHVLIVLFTLTGMLLAYGVVRVVSITKVPGSSTHKVLSAYHFGGGILRGRDTFASVLASIITIGFGGSAGFEGPSLATGGGIASVLTKKLKLHMEEIRVLTLAGAAAGFSALFRAPLTGIFFALELPYQRDLAKEAFVPATVACIVSYITSVLLLGKTMMIPFIPVPPAVPTALDVLHLVVIGAIAGFVGYCYAKLFRVMENSVFRSVVKGDWSIVLLGGLAIGALGLLDPAVLGEGDEYIHAFIIGGLKTTCWFILLTLVLKIVATCITMNFGGSGGVFFPALFLGAATGALYNMVFLGGSWNEAYVMAATAAVMAASLKTPFTGVALVAETCGPSAIIPALISSAISYFASGRFSLFINQFEHRPEEEERALDEAYYLLQECGYLKETGIKASELSIPAAFTIKRGTPATKALRILEGYRIREAPVIDEYGKLIGYVAMEDLLSLVLEDPEALVDEIIIHAPLTAFVNEDLAFIAKKLVESGEDRVYVISSDGKLVGVILRSYVLSILLEFLRKIPEIKQLTI